MTEKVENKNDTKKGVTRWLIREIMGGLFAGLIVFLAAGRIDLVWGWALVGVYLAWTAATAVVLIPRCPELLVERATRQKSMKSWDARLMSVIGLLTVVKYVVAGLDLRYAWTAGLPLATHWAALMIGLAAFALLTWSMAANAFFSMIVRIQDDRQHAVADTGPYRIIRHPGYVGKPFYRVNLGVGAVPLKNVNVNKEYARYNRKPDKGIKHHDVSDRPFLVFGAVRELLVFEYRRDHPDERGNKSSEFKLFLIGLFIQQCVLMKVV